MAFEYHHTKRTISDNYLNSLIKDLRFASMTKFKARSYTKRMFLANGVSTAEVHEILLPELIALAGETLDGQRDPNQENFSRILSQLATEDIPVRDLLHVHTVLTRLGYFCLAQKCRVLAKTSAVSIYQRYGRNASDQSALEAFYGMFENGELISAAKIISERPWMVKSVANLLPLATILHKFGYLKSNALTQTSIDLQRNSGPCFIDYIKGKRVALVGPGVPDKEDGAEIDDADIVVRINCMHSVFEEDHKYQGSKTSVVYCVPKLFRKNIPSNFPRFERYDKATYIVSSEPAFSDGVSLGLFPQHLVSESNHKDAMSVGKISSSPDNVGLFNGHLNFGPRIIFDLFKREAAAISVYNMDFRTTAGYAAGYRPTDERDIETSARILRDVSSNDQFSAFKFVQLFSAKGVVQGGGEFLQLMKKSDDEFYNLMERTWRTRRGNILRYEWKRRKYLSRIKRKISSVLVRNA